MFIIIFLCYFFTFKGVSYHNIFNSISLLKDTHLTQQGHPTSELTLVYHMRYQSQAILKSVGSQCHYPKSQSSAQVRPGNSLLSPAWSSPHCVPERRDPKGALQFISCPLSSWRGGWRRDRPKPCNCTQLPTAATEEKTQQCHLAGRTSAWSFWSSQKATAEGKRCIKNKK